MSETLQEFLVSVKYQVDTASQQNFLNTLRRVATSVGGLAGEVGLLGVAIVEMAKHIAEAGEQLYFMSMRLGDSADSIKSATYAMTQFGMSTGEAVSQLEAFGRWTRETGPASDAWFRRLGITATDNAGRLLQMGDAFRRLGGTLEFMHGTPEQRRRYALALQNAAVMHLTEQQMLDFSSGDYNRRERESRDVQRRTGMDWGKFAATSRELMVTWRSIGLIIDNLFGLFGQQLMQGVNADLTHFLATLNQNLPELTEFAKQLGNALAFLFHWIMLFVDGAVRMIGIFEHLPAVLQIALAGFAAFQSGLLKLGVGLLTSPWFWFFAMMTAMLALLDDFETWKRGGQSAFNWSWTQGITDFGKDILGINDLFGDLLALFSVGLPAAVAIFVRSLATIPVAAAGGATAAAQIATAKAAQAAANAAPAAGATGWLGTAAAWAARLTPWAIGAYLGFTVGKTPIAEQEQENILLGRDPKGGAFTAGPSLAPSTPSAGTPPPSGPPNPALAGTLTSLPGDPSWGDYGTRANNPGNMNYADWEGASGRFNYMDQREGRQHTMAVFNTMQEGVAAAYRLMQRNQASHHAMTLAAALAGWSTTPGYAGKVAGTAGVDVNAPFDVTTADPQLVERIMASQFRWEGGKGSHHATPEQILQGIQLARGGIVPGGAGGAQPTRTQGGAAVNIHQQTTVQVQPGPTAGATAGAVAQAQGRVNEQLVRDAGTVLR